jgi:CRP/FNR family cyclic AMP-dependent transcriptional regulator
MQLEEAIEAARRSRWLAQFDRRTQDLIASRMRLVSLPKNRMLFDIEDSAADIYCMVSGCAVITIPHPVQGVVNAHVMFAGRWFGEPAALGRRPRIMSVLARRPTELLALPQARVAELLKAEPALDWVFFNLMAWNVEEYLLHAVDLLIVDPRLRLYSRLLTFAGRLLTYLPPPPVAIPMTQEELAVASNMSRSTVYHFLTELAERKICEIGYREIRILDVGRLDALVREHS